MGGQSFGVRIGHMRPQVTLVEKSRNGGTQMHHAGRVRYAAGIVRRNFGNDDTIKSFNVEYRNIPVGRFERAHHTLAYPRSATKCGGTTAVRHVGSAGALTIHQRTY